MEHGGQVFRVTTVWTDGDLDGLARRLRGLTARRSSVAVGLWGEAGIGKTYAVQALLRETPCRSLSVGAGLPLGTLASLLPRPARLPGWAAQVLDRLEGAAPNPSSHADALAAALSALAPFVLHLEDLHETGPERLALLSALAGRLVHSRGAALVVTGRAPPPEGFGALRLEALDEAASAALLQGEAGAALPAYALNWIHARAAGNPLFTLEYFRLLARQGPLWNDGRQWRWREPQADRLPPTVEALIEGKLLPVSGRAPLEEVLGAVALLPAEPVPALLAQVAGCSGAALLEGQATLERLGILRGQGFAHPLYREVTLSLLGAEVRRRLIDRARLALNDDPCAACAFLGPPETEAGESLDLLRRAAAAAGLAGDAVREARFRAQAEPYASGAARGELAGQAARALIFVDSAEAFRLARIATQAGPQSVEATLTLALCHAAAGQGQEVEALLAPLSRDQGTQAEWLAQLMALRFGLQDYPAVLTLWAEYRALQAAPEPMVAYHAAFAFLMAGQRLDEAQAVAEGALAQGEGRPEPLAESRLQNVLGLVHLYRDTAPELALARPCFERAVALARSGPQPAWLASTLHNRSLLLERLERHHEMARDVREAMELYAQTGLTRHFASSQIKLARYLHDLGDDPQAEERLLDSRALLRRGDASSFLATCEATLSDLYREWNPPHAAVLALKHAREALRLARTLGQRGKLYMALIQTSLAEGHFGDPARAWALAQELEALSTEDDLAAEELAEIQLTVAHAHEALGQRGEALALFQEAEATAARGQLLSYAQRIGLEVARLTGDAPRAQALRVWFGERGLYGGVHLVDRYFPGLEGAFASTPRAGPSPSPPGAALDVLGPMRCGPPGAPGPVRGRKRQELLACLLEARLRGRGEASRLELMETLYPGAEEAHALSALREVVHQARLSLGAGMIHTTDLGYALGETTSDAEGFLRTGDTRLWRGGYLSGIDLPGDLIKETLYHALQERAEAVLEGDPAEAARCGKLLCEADPYDPAALSLTLRAHQAAGNHRTLGRVYAAARQQWDEVGEPLPADWHAFLTAHPPPASA